MTQRSSKMARWRPRLGAGMAGFAVLMALIFGVRTALVEGPVGGGTIENGCMQDVYDQYNDGQVDGDTLNCTANDIELASVTNINITDDGCAFPGDTVTFDFTAAVQLTADARYDIGIYFAIDGDPNGDGALTGVCSISTLPYAGEFYNPDFGTGYYVDLDGTDDDPGGTIQDTCGDIEDSAAQVPNETNPILVDIAGITAICNDADGDGNLDLPYATSWRQPGANELCTSPLNAFPGGPSKCNTDTGFSVPIPVPKAIEVRKALIPVDDLGRFNLQIDGVTDPDAENVGDGGSTGKEAVDAGTHLVGEEGYGDTDLNDYSISIACVDQTGRCSGDSTIHCVNDAVCAANDAGTCEFTYPLVASCTDCTSVQVEVPNKQSDIVCTITNQRSTGSLEVIKDVQPDDATTNWNIDVSGPTPFSDTLSGDDTTGARTVDTGDYTIVETAGSGTNLDDYATTYACTVDGAPGPEGTGTTINVTVGEDEVVLCTFTNTRKTGTLEVVKDVQPDDATTNWNIDVSGPTSFSVTLSGDDTTGAQTVDTGDYTIVETAGSGTSLDDYITTYACTVDGGTGPQGTGTTINVTVGEDEAVVCTYANEVKTSSIIVVKETDPPDADESFDFTSNTTPDAFSLSHDGSQPFPDLQPNATYAFTETVPADWELKEIFCSGQDNSDIAYGDTGVTIDLAPDEAIICTFTDDPLPVITVVKSADPLRVANPGDPVTYTVQVTNNTPAGEPVTLTSLSDDIYGDLTYAGNPKLSSTTCELVTIQAGEPYSCSFVAGVIGEWGRSTTDTVTATAEDDEGNTAQDDDIATVTIEEEIPLEMTVVKTADPEAILAPGGPVTYKVEVTNNGLANMQLTLTSLVDTVYGDVTDPSNPKLLSTTCSNGSTIDPLGTYECAFQAEVTGEAGYVETDIVSATAVDPYGREVQDYDDATVLIYVKPPDTGVDLPTPLIVGALAVFGAALLAAGVYVRQQTVRVG